MGFFGTYLYSQGAWSNADPNIGVHPTCIEPWLYLDIHDSSITTIRYSPRGDGSGEAFLGSTPRTYFDDPSASKATDVSHEAGALSAWLRAATGKSIEPDTVRLYLASDGELLSEDDDDAEIFVELKTARFLATAGLPVPLDLQS